MHDEAASLQLPCWIHLPCKWLHWDMDLRHTHLCPLDSPFLPSQKDKHKSSHQLNPCVFATIKLNSHQLYYRTSRILTYKTRGIILTWSRGAVINVHIASISTPPCRAVAGVAIDKVLTCAAIFTRRGIAVIGVGLTALSLVTVQTWTAKGVDFILMREREKLVNWTKLSPTPYLTYSSILARVGATVINIDTTVVSLPPSSTGTSETGYTILWVSRTKMSIHSIMQ